MTVMGGHADQETETWPSRLYDRVAERAKAATMEKGSHVLGTYEKYPAPPGYTPFQGFCAVVVTVLFWLGVVALAAVAITVTGLGIVAAFKAAGLVTGCVVGAIALAFVTWRAVK